MHPTRKTNNPSHFHQQQQVRPSIAATTSNANGSTAAVRSTAKSAAAGHLGGASTGINSGGNAAGNVNASGAGCASPVLVARIREKTAELENLRELNRLSLQMAAQMQALEERLATMNSGAEAVALVLSNWHHILSAINMASTAAATKVNNNNAKQTNESVASEVRDETATDGRDTHVSYERYPRPKQLPQTLVRIPVQPAATSTSITSDSGPGPGPGS